MLVLQRSVGQAIRIGPDEGPHIWVTVLSISRGHVRLGIAADPEVKIYREELLPLKEPSDRE